MRHLHPHPSVLVLLAGRGGPAHLNLREGGLPSCGMVFSQGTGAQEAHGQHGTPCGYLGCILPQL